jgi:hypothetical protein
LGISILSSHSLEHLEDERDMLILQRLFVGASSAITFLAILQRLVIPNRLLDIANPILRCNPIKRTEVPDVYSFAFDVDIDECEADLAPGGD